MWPDSRIKLKASLYAAVCLAALAYLAVANAAGYVPFTSQATRTSEHTANHFHK
jgi:hypothetical protein